MAASKIEWTDATLNPVVGCTKIAAGCKNCYAERIHNQRHRKKAYLVGMSSQYAKPFSEVQILPERIEQPLHWRTPRTIFWCSMSDLFHKDVPFGLIDKVMAVITLTPRHTHLVLTKRPERLLEYYQQEPRGQIDHAILDGIAAFVGRGKPYAGKGLTRHLGDRDGLWPPPNLWLGVSCSNQADADRNIPILLQIPAAVHFVSLEPLLKGLDLTHIRYPLWARSQYMNVLTGKSSPSLDGLAPTRSLGWVTVGGESGPKRRPCKLQWIRSIVNQCKEAGVPVFVKQLHINGKVSKNPEEWPEDLRIREYPDG